MKLIAAIWIAHLAQALWQASATAVIALGIAAVLPRRHAGIRHGVLLLAIVKFALPPMLPSPTGIFSSAPPASEMSALGYGIDWLSRVPYLLELVFLVHLAGIAFALARLAASAATLRRIRRSAAPLSIGGAGDVLKAVSCGTAVLVSDAIAVPIAFGLWRPVIALPRALVTTLSAGQLRDVVAHEAEHIRRRDVALNTAQALLAAFWWWNPLFGFLERTTRSAREERCDDGVIARHAIDVTGYARTLLQTATFAPARPTRLAAHIAESRTSLRRRVQRLAAPAFRPGAALGGAGTLLLLFLALLLLPGVRVSRDNRVAFDHATVFALHLHPH